MSEMDSSHGRARRPGRRRPLGLAVLVAGILVPSMVSVPARSQQVGEGGDPRVLELAERLDRLASRRAGDLPDARIGVAVMDLVTGKILYERASGETFNSASNTKIVTAAAALALLGPDFRYRTSAYALDVGADGTVAGDLYLRGRGDPSFGSADMFELAREVASAGIRKVRGGITVDTSYFDGEDLPPHFDEQPDEQASFRAPVGATSLNFNMVAIRVRPASRGSGPAEIRIDFPSDYVRVTGVVDTVSRGRTRLRIGSTARRGELEVTVSGQIRRDAGERAYRLRVPDPAAYVGAAFRRALAVHGVSVARAKVAIAEVPPEARALSHRNSPPLAVLVRGLGKYSNNCVAEMLLKTIGAATREPAGPATWEDGLTAVRAYLHEQAGLEPGTFRYGNGSGLFDSNEFTPLQLVRILAAAHRDSRYSSDLVSSLAISAADGTLRSRMAEGPAERVVRAKTGTLATASALSGYIALDGRFPLAFSVLVNDFPRGSAGSARRLQDEVCEALAGYLQTGE
jgi:serine-type D-Ala-D-Ala carboxypeptidase/endopeptidase (penicillin-binding protein 4)